MTYAVPTEHTSPRFARAFALGCKGRATNDDQLQPGPVALWGSPERWGLLQQAIREGRDWWYADHGFYRRGKCYRVAKNAYQYVPTHDDILAAKPDRLRACHVDVTHEWQTDGTAIVICPNSPEYMARFGIDAHQWVLDLVDRLGRLAPNRPIVVRWKAMAQRRPLYLDLHNAYAVVVFSSNAAIEALCAGVPVFVLAEWATARQMGRGTIDEINRPYYPELRIPFLWRLAERQWSLVEIESGMAWKDLHTV